MWVDHPKGVFLVFDMTIDLVSSHGTTTGSCVYVTTFEPVQPDIAIILQRSMIS